MPKDDLINDGLGAVDDAPNERLDIRDVEITDSFKGSEIPTTVRETVAWWTYDAASSPFVGVAINAFFPQLMTLLCAEEGRMSQRVGMRCGSGGTFAPESYFSFLVSVSVIFQAVLFLFVSAHADFGHLRKVLLSISTFISSVACMCVFAVQPTTFWLGGLLMVVANAGFGIASIYYNSFMPLLVRNEPRLPSKDDATFVASFEGLQNWYSVVGVSVGNISVVMLFIVGLLCLAFVFPPECRPVCDACSSASDLEGTECPVNCVDYDSSACDRTFLASRALIAACGAVWLIGFVPFLIWIKSRPGPVYPRGSAWMLGVRRMVMTVKHHKQIPQTFLFFAAFWLYSDGFATLLFAAALVGIQAVGLTGFQLGLGMLIGNLTAVLGAAIALWLNRRNPKIFTARRILLGNIGITSLLPLYARIPGLFTTAWEFYMLAFIVGSQTGSANAFSRSILASGMIPRGRESEFFAFYEITNKGTAWLGPLVFAITNELTGDMRWAAFVIVIFFLAGAYILWKVDTVKGRRDAELVSLMPSAFAFRESGQIYEGVSNDSNISTSSEAEAVSVSLEDSSHDG